MREYFAQTLHLGYITACHLNQVLKHPIATYSLAINYVLTAIKATPT